jgi:hypothetical protein
LRVPINLTPYEDSLVIGLHALEYLDQLALKRVLILSHLLLLKQSLVPLDSVGSSSTASNPILARETLNVHLSALWESALQMLLL